MGAVAFRHIVQIDEHLLIVEDRNRWRLMDLAFWCEHINYVKCEPHFHPVIGDTILLSPLCVHILFLIFDQLRNTIRFDSVWHLHLNVTGLNWRGRQTDKKYGLL